MTSGDKQGANGVEERRARLAALLAYAPVGLAFAVVNAASEVDDRARMGRPVESWEPWAWELSSCAAFLLIAPLIFRASQRLRPPRLSWPAAGALFALLSVPASLAHVTLMVGLRHAVYGALGDSYSGPGNLAEVLLYEYRKDLITYAALLLLPHVAARLLDSRRGIGAAAKPYRIQVRDGSRTRWLAPGEIDWAQAAGNYVELRGAFGSVLDRRTLAALADELAPHGFARIHRSRIVRASAICTLDSKPSGDFDVTLANGDTVGGSRRYRSNLP